MVRDDRDSVIRIALTPGEPAGIGPDICVQLAQEPWPFEIVTICDPALLKSRARALAISLELIAYDPKRPATPQASGTLTVLPQRLEHDAVPGQPDPTNARSLLDALSRAVSGCQNREFEAMVTGPVNKAVINQAGIAFSGHTEFLAYLTRTPQVVMMLAIPGLRVALVTTHMSLAEVPLAITASRLQATLRVLHDGLRDMFAVLNPRILVCGLNPHAGEGGYLGREEQEVIIPVLRELASQGLHVTGPVPADTAFVPRMLADFDVVLAMYHDQGLPVLKHPRSADRAHIRRPRHRHRVGRVGPRGLKKPTRSPEHRRRHDSQPP
jgi:4-hydroxythreonine-4-phosphate dehydrogenase